MNRTIIIRPQVLRPSCMVISWVTASVIGVQLTLGSLAISPPPSLAQTPTTPTQPLTPTHERAIRELIRTQISPEYMEYTYNSAAREASEAYQPFAEILVERSLRDDEKQRLQQFWYRRIKTLMPYEKLETLMVPIFGQHFSLNELEEILRFTRTPIGKKMVALMPKLMQDAEKAGASLAEKMLTDKAIEQMTTDLKAEFPDWFRKK